MTYSIRLAFITSVVVLSSYAQSPTEQLQKGIYLQETAGDFDAALQTYRQIIATAPAQSTTAAQAQYRIAQLLLQKGDLSGAATEFNILASRYSDQKPLIAKMAASVRGLHEQQLAGTVEGGRYKDRRTGLEFPVPTTWKTIGNGPSSDGGEMVSFSDGTSIDYFVWTRPDVTPAAEIAQVRQGEIPNKARTMGGAYPDFAFRQESIQVRSFGSNQALTAIGDYTAGPRKLCAYYIWVYTAKTHVLFAARNVPSAELAIAQSQLDQLVSTAMIQ